MNEKINKFPEITDLAEKFVDWWDPDLPKVYFAMNSRAGTSYRKGD
jgi:hypothetical protein